MRWPGLINSMLARAVPSPRLAGLSWRLAAGLTRRVHTEKTFANLDDVDGFSKAQRAHGDGAPQRPPCTLAQLELAASSLRMRLDLPSHSDADLRFDSTYTRCARRAPPAHGRRARVARTRGRV
jgi:hypothetical protein